MDDEPSCMTLNSIERIGADRQSVVVPPAHPPAPAAHVDDELKHGDYGTTFVVVKIRTNI